MTQQYMIRAGCKYSAGPLGTLWRGLFGWQLRGYIGALVTLDSSWLAANMKDPLDADDERKDIHKLLGLSEGWGHPHHNSARFGLNEVAGEIMLYAYVYRNGIWRGRVPIVTVQADRPFYAEISRHEHWWVFTVCDEHGNLLASCEMEAEPHRPVVYHRLYPYYGGDIPAPIDTYTWIEWI